MCWSKYEERWREEAEEQRSEDELRRLEAETEERAERILAQDKEAREPVRTA